MQHNNTHGFDGHDDLTGEEFDDTHTPVMPPVDLADLDEDYTQAEVQEDSFDAVPDGKYQVAVAKVHIARSKTSGAPMLKWQLKILGPTHAGRYLFRNNMLRKESLAWLKTDLHRCGVALEKVSDLPSRLNDLLDIALEVTKKTKGDNENVYIGKRIEVAAPSPELTPF